MSMPYPPSVYTNLFSFFHKDDLGVGRLERLVEDEEGGRRRTASERPIQRQSDRSPFNDPGAKAFNGKCSVLGVTLCFIPRAVYLFLFILFFFFLLL